MSRVEMAAFFAFMMAAAAGATSIRARGQWRWVSLAGGVLLLGAGLVALPSGLGLDKLAARLVMPAGFVWIAASSGALWAFARGRDRAALGWGLVASLVWVAGAPVLGDALVRRLEAPHRDIEPLEGPRLDAVVVLGGGTRDIGHRAQLDLAGDRVLLGAQLYRSGRAARLVTTGSSLVQLGPFRDLTEETSEIWMSLGIPERDIVRLSAPKNTRQELAAVQAWVETSTSVRTVGLVTSAWHMDRALAQARRVGLQVVPLPADVQSVEGHDANLQDFIPSGPGFFKVHRASWELLGRAVGR